MLRVWIITFDFVLKRFLSLLITKPSVVFDFYSTVSIGDPSNIISSCNQDCYCRTDVYEPICDDSSRQYYSPCYAGCTGILSYGDEVMDKLKTA